MKEENEGEEQKTTEEQTESAEATEEGMKEKAEEAPEKKEEAAGEEVKAEEEAPTPIEEEAKPPPREEKPEEEEIVEERIYTIPMSRAWIAPANRRAPSAVRIIRSFVTKHMKLEARREEEEAEEEPKRLVISNEVNEAVWRSGIEKPPRRIRVRAAKDKDGNVTVYLAEGE